MSEEAGVIEDEKIPDDWMKILVVDPGTARSGFLCLAVPAPPADDKKDYKPRHVHVYAERMLYNADASEMAKQAKSLVGSMKFEIFLIDKRAGRQTPMGFSRTVKEQYAAEFKAQGVKSRLTGYDFEYTSDNVEARELQLKEWIEPGEDGLITLIVRPHLSALDSQMNGFFRKKSDPTKREERIVLELVHCLEYAAAYFDGRLWYNDPEPVDEIDTLDPVVRLMREMEAKGWQLTKKKPKALSFGCTDDGKSI